MILGIPLTIFFGILTFISLITTVSLGLILHYLHRPVFKYHRFFAFLTITLAVIHVILVLSFYFQGNKGGSEESLFEETVLIKDFAFSPFEITVKKGTKITWQNNDPVIHTATSGNGVFDSGSLSQGEAYDYTFNETGTFNYICAPHPFMKGRIIVE